MATEREISSKTDLSLDEAVKERLELIEYRKSEDWTHYVIEKIERRIANLNNLIAEKVTECFNHGDTLIAINSEKNKKNSKKIKEFFESLK